MAVRNGDICIVRVPYNSVVHYYCNALANANVAGCHLDCDNYSDQWVWFHAEVIDVNTWASVRLGLLFSGYRYEVYRLPSYMSSSACLSYWQDVMNNYADDRYRIPQWQFGSCPGCTDWDYAITHGGNLQNIYNQKHADQSYADYWDISRYNYRKSYQYCISLTWDAMIHAWYVRDHNVKNIITRNHVQFYHNSMPGQLHYWLRTATTRIY
jgi:hypothetical protein